MGQRRESVSKVNNKQVQRDSNKWYTVNNWCVHIKAEMLGLIWDKRKRKALELIYDEREC